MYLYLVKRTDDCGYDEYDGVVLRAKTKDRALEMATRRAETRSDLFPRLAQYEGFAVDGSNLTVACIGKAYRQHEDEDEGEVLSDFNAG